MVANRTREGEPKITIVALVGVGDSCRRKVNVSEDPQGHAARDPWDGPNMFSATRLLGGLVSHGFGRTARNALGGGGMMGTAAKVAGVAAVGGAAYAAYRQWRVLGAAEAMADYAQPIRKIQVTDGRSPGAAAKPALPVFLEFDASDIADRAGDEPLGWMLENRHIRLGLTEALKATDVTVIAPRRAVDIEASATGAEVLLDDGQRLRCQLAVGCEGRRSPLREAAGIGVTGWSYKQTGMVATVALEHDHQGVAFEHFLPTGPFAILPLKPDGKGTNRSSIVWTERTEVADRLVKAGQPPTVLTSGAIVGSEQATELFEAAYDEHARRLAKLYKNLGNT